ncbi:MAG: hypothetical protein ACI8W8_004661, partial [Rhodothermales bacterium]
SLTIEYRLRIPFDQAWVEMAGMDADGNGKVSDAEKQAFLSAKADYLRSNMTLSCSGNTLELELIDFGLDAAISQTFTFRTSVTGPCELRDQNFRGQPGSLRLLSDDATTVTTADKADMNHAEDLALTITRKIE